VDYAPSRRLQPAANAGRTASGFFRQPAILTGQKINVPLGEDGEKTAATHLEVVVTKATDKATTTTAGKPSVERSR